MAVPFHYLPVLLCQFGPLYLVIIGGKGARTMERLSEFSPLWTEIFVLASSKPTDVLRYMDCLASTKMIKGHQEANLIFA